MHLCEPSSLHRLRSDKTRVRVGHPRRKRAWVTHLEHLRPDLCRAVSHNDPGLLEGGNLVRSST